MEALYKECGGGSSKPYPVKSFEGQPKSSVACLSHYFRYKKQRINTPVLTALTKQNVDKSINGGFRDGKTNLNSLEIHVVS